MTTALLTAALILSGQGGVLTISNPGERPVVIATAIAVQAQQPGGWLTLGSKFDAIADCAEHRGPSTTIAAHGVLHVSRWRGCSCMSQCETGCRANICYAPGVFRFRVQVVGGSAVTSPPFALGPESRGR